MAPSGTLLNNPGPFGPAAGRITPDEPEQAGRFGTAGGEIVRISGYGGEPER